MVFVNVHRQIRKLANAWDDSVESLIRENQVGHVIAHALQHLQEDNVGRAARSREPLGFGLRYKAFLLSRFLRPGGILLLGISAAAA